MGVERVLQAAGWLTLLVALAVAAPSRRERIAIIDLGPPDPQARQKLAAAAVDGGLDPLLSDGIADALAGESHDPDAAQLRAALADAQRAYGALDCKATLAASKTAIGLAAARQASGLPVPELARALTYVLLCADRAGDVDAAMAAAAHLRTLGRSAAEPGDVPPELWAKYPEVDVMIDRDMIPVELRADVAGAELWVDCTVAATAARALAVRGDRRFVPRRPAGRSQPALMRALCVLASYERLQMSDEVSLLPSFVPAKGLERIEIAFDPLSDVDADGDGDPHTARTEVLVPRAEVVVPEIEDLIRAFSRCTGTTCTSADREFRFGLRASGGQLYLARLEIVELPPCR